MSQICAAVRWTYVSGYHLVEPASRFLRYADEIGMSLVCQTQRNSFIGVHAYLNSNSSVSCYTPQMDHPVLTEFGYVWVMLSFCRKVPAL